MMTHQPHTNLEKSLSGLSSFQEQMKRQDQEAKVLVSDKKQKFLVIRKKLEEYGDTITFFAKSFRDKVLEAVQMGILAYPQE